MRGMISNIPARTKPQQQEVQNHKLHLRDQCCRAAHSKTCGQVWVMHVASPNAPVYHPHQKNCRTEQWFSGAILKNAMRYMTGKRVWDVCISCNFMLARISPVKWNYMTWKMIWEIDFWSWNGLHDRINYIGICLVNILAWMVFVFILLCCKWRKSTCLCIILSLLFIVLAKLRWVKSHDSYCRIASKSYPRNSNH